MRANLILFLWLVFSVALQAQVQVSRTHHHFGQLSAGSERFTDFVISNKSGKKLFILRTETDRDVSTLISNKTVLPDSSATIRVQYNPRQSGRFSREIGVFLSSSNEPLLLGISGEVKEMPLTSDLACPDFGKVKEAGYIPEFELEVRVIDRLTGEPVEKADVKIIYKGLPKYRFSSNREGEIIKKIELGYYYFVTQAQHYKTEEFDAYVNVRNNKILVELDPLNVRPVDEPANDSAFYQDHTRPVLDPGRPRPEDLQPLLTTEDQLLSPRDTQNILVQSLPEKTETKAEYKYNNLVFLIDVSASMMTDGKMDLLKASMLELCNSLGPEDRVSVVVYSSSARVVLENVAGNDKEQIIEKIQNMEGSGYTAGFEGMKLAYEIANRHFMKDGNNMVIMATDGAFNLYTNDVTPMVKRNVKKGIHTSVLAIKNTDSDSRSMQTIAGLGGGRYIPINNLEEALSKLKEEVRTASLR